ncbi:hypothetical protein NKH77_54170 [Streptomyces sp. M19]
MLQKATGVAVRTMPNVFLYTVPRILARNPKVSKIPSYPVVQRFEGSPSHDHPRAPGGGRRRAPPLPAGAAARPRPALAGPDRRRHRHRLRPRLAADLRARRPVRRQPAAAVLGDLATRPTSRAWSTSSASTDPCTRSTSAGSAAPSPATWARRGSPACPSPTASPRPSRSTCPSPDSPCCSPY